MMLNKIIELAMSYQSYRELNCEDQCLVANKVMGKLSRKLKYTDKDTHNAIEDTLKEL